MHLLTQWQQRASWARPSLVVCPRGVARDLVKRLLPGPFGLPQIGAESPGPLAVPRDDGLAHCHAQPLDPLLQLLHWVHGQDYTPFQEFPASSSNYLSLSLMQVASGSRRAGAGT